ncbi:MliC family protein [Caviibacterium pharyngocola]|uniref:Lysozyme inhibitor n=1 Tax=Caviibacterium pharyngocola TaxID=28159 RepID=A0A2M8RUQ6_9PAST|nr:MliC family protein [Caviibacterium pharyngocola]PJG82628.1 lysozyme inhibitor [Caviibacterium pharyngocola]
MKLNKFSMFGLITISLVPLISQATQKNYSHDELTKIVYACENNAILDVVYVNTNRGSYAIINQVGEMIPMENVKSASGAVYKSLHPDYTYELVTKGKSAELFADNKSILANCISE